MFQSLRPNNKVYILHKDAPCLEIGTVTNVSMPTPKYQLPTFSPNQEMVVDLVVKVDGKEITYQKIPASLDIADFGTTGIVLADTKDAINAEIVSLKQKSEDVIASIPFHENVVTSCEEMLKTLNPEFAEKKAQQEEITSLKEQMGVMSKSLTELMETNKRLLEKLNLHQYENVRN